MNGGFGYVKGHLELVCVLEPSSYWKFLMPIMVLFLLSDVSAFCAENI